MIKDFNIDEVKILINEQANKYIAECETIFDENGKGHILNRDGIADREKYELFVAVYKNHAIAYQLLYIGGDFIRGEGYIEEYDNGLKFEDDAVYFWDICTKKIFQNHGVQKKIFALVKALFPYQNFYTMTDAENKNSLSLQKGVGFKILKGCSFYENWNGEMCRFHVLKRKALKKKPKLLKSTK